MPPTQVYSYRALSTSSSTLSPTTLNILKCNFSLACCWSYILCSKLGLGLAASARFRTNYNSFWFSVSLQMQKCKMASRPLSQDGMDGMVWYGMVWYKMGWDVCLSVDRWSLWPPMIKFCVSFEAYMRKCLWSPHIPSGIDPPPSGAVAFTDRGQCIWICLAGSQIDRQPISPSPVRSAIMPVCTVCSGALKEIVYLFKF